MASTKDTEVEIEDEAAIAMSGGEPEEEEIDVDVESDGLAVCRKHHLERCSDCGLDFTELNGELRASKK
jgi:hypothetical protein